MLKVDVKLKIIVIKLLKKYKNYCNIIIIMLFPSLLVLFFITMMESKYEGDYSQIKAQHISMFDATTKPFRE